MRSFQVVSGENGSPQQFNALRDDARASSFLLAQQMLGYFTLSTNPSNTQTLTLDINGTNVVFTFVTTIGTTAGNVLIGASAAATVANLLALLQQPQTTTSTGVALSSANIQLVSYLTFAAPSGGTTLYVMSNNTNLYAPLTSFSASTTASSDTWTSQTMQLYVHAGTVYVGGTRVLWTGGATPTVTAPVSHPRIDVLAVDNTGTLSWTTGTENASPSAPTYPANKVAICELYNVVSETALYDFEDQQSGQGYIYNDVRPIIGTAINLLDVTSDIIPDADGTRNLGSSSYEWNNLYVKSGIYLNGAAFGSQLTFAATAAESIAAGAAVAAGYYQSDGGVKVDFTSGYQVVGSSGSYSQSVTIGSNSNRVFVVGIVYHSNDSVSSVALNGTSLTTVYNQNSSSNGSRMYVGILVAPPTGTHNLTWTQSQSTTVAISVWSLYQAAQTGQPDNYAVAYNDSTAAVISTTITPSTIGDFLITFANISQFTGGGLTWENNGNQTGTSGNIYYGDANKTFPLQTLTITTSPNATDGTAIAVAIKPYTTASVGALVNASASNTASPYPDNFSGYRSTAALGFAVSSVSAGSTVTAVIGGVVTGLSGLTEGLQYFLSNTGGAIATTAGSITRKIGIAVSTTQLLITNIW